MEKRIRRMENIVKNCAENGTNEIGDSIAIENPSSGLVDCITGMLAKVQPFGSTDGYIYRVPNKVRKIDEEAYTPRIVSIGPFHRGNERLRFMEASKLRYFKKFLERGNMNLGTCVEVVKGYKGRARDCYIDNIEMGDDEFVTMILVDCGFIIEVLLRSYFSDLREQNDLMFYTPSMHSDLIHDLLLLENQIPFFLLEKLLNLANGSFPCFPSLLQLSFSFFGYHNKQKKPPNFISVNHFTDLLRIFYLPTLPRTDHGKFEIVYGATQLHESGVKFKVGSSKCLFDIQFSNGVLEIPGFILDDDMKSYIRNLMALEFCHYPNESYVIDYMGFMDKLINTPKDVDLLFENGIIENWLGDSSEVTTFFNSVGTNVAMGNNFYFSRLSKELNAYYKVPWHKWKAICKHQYFSTPWRTASTIAAVILLLLTLIQTVCSIVSLKPNAP